MKRFGIVQRVYEEAAGDEGKSGNGGGSEKGGGESAPKTFNVNGKDVPIETLSQALNLHNALADPDTGKEIIEQLARRTGLLDKNDDLKGSPEKAGRVLEGRVQKMLKSKFGKEYEKFADTLGPVLDEAIQEYLEEHKTTIETKSTEGGWADAVDKFTESHRISDEVGKEMERLIKRNGGRPNIKGKEATEYLSDMYQLAVNKLGGKIEEVDDEDDERDNRPRTTRRNRGPERPEFREVARPKNPSLDEIVDAAMRGQRFRS